MIKVFQIITPCNLVGGSSVSEECTASMFRVEVIAIFSVTTSCSPLSVYHRFGST
jgi:hypothetical protein